ncbi:MAG: type IV secretion system DNA-binding domain-containing protein [Pseudomonadota bacterium]
MNTHEARLGTDFVRGMGLWRRQTQSQLQSWTALVASGVVAGLVVAILVLVWQHGAYRLVAMPTFHVATLLAGSTISSEIALPVWTSGGWQGWLPAAIANDDWFVGNAGRVSRSLLPALGLAASTMAIIVVGGVFIARRLGRRARTLHRFRGREVVPARALARQVRRRGQASDVTIGGVPLIEGTETQHVLLLGTTGAGKTQAMLRTLVQIEGRGDAAVVYDRAGTYLPRFFRPERGDVVLNPLDARSADWSPWSEIAWEADADRLAAALIPPGSKDERFFADAARALLAAALVRLAKSETRSLEALLRLLLIADWETKRAFFAGSEAAKYFTDEAGKMGASVDANMATYVRSLRVLRGGAGNRGDFSITAFVEALDDERRPKPWLFLTSRPKEEETLTPLLTAFVDTAVAALLSLKECPERRLWFCLDELASLNQVPKLPALMAEGRKFGGCVVVGLQDPAQLLDVYGRHGARTMLSLFNTTVLFRLGDVESARWAAQLLGDVDLEHAKESARYSPTGDEPTGVQLSANRRMEPLVLAASIMDLEPLEHFLVLPGRWPIGRGRLGDPRRLRLPERVPSFVKADLDNRLLRVLVRSAQPARAVGASEDHVPMAKATRSRAKAPAADEAAATPDLFGPRLRVRPPDDAT